MLVVAHVLAPVRLAASEPGPTVSAAQVADGTSAAVSDVPRPEVTTAAIGPVTLATPTTRAAAPDASTVSRPLADWILAVPARRWRHRGQPRP